MNKKIEPSIVRSSAAEYLTFVAASGKGGVQAVYADENVWLTQKMMGALYDVETHTINYHLKKIFADSDSRKISCCIARLSGASSGGLHSQCGMARPPMPKRSQASRKTGSAATSGLDSAT